jgi:hypothetical protein
MKTLLQPIGPEIKWHKGSDITEISQSASGLRVVLASPEGEERYVEFHFPFVRAFQVMDEGDMLEFWQNPVAAGHALYKVVSGGWRDRVEGQFLHVTSALDNMIEWLIVSECLCVSVISPYVPHAREFGDGA